MSMVGQSETPLAILERAVRIWTDSEDLGYLDALWTEPQCGFFVAVRDLVAETAKRSSLFDAPKAKEPGIYETDTSLPTTSMEWLNWLCREFKPETDLIEQIHQRVRNSSRSVRENSAETAVDPAVAVLRPHGVFHYADYQSLLASITPRNDSTQSSDVKFRNAIGWKLYAQLIQAMDLMGDNDKQQTLKSIEEGTFRFSILAAAFAHIARAAIALASWDPASGTPEVSVCEDLRIAMQCLHFVYPLLTESCLQDTNQWEQDGLEPLRSFRGTLAMRKLSEKYCDTVPRSAWLAVQHVLKWLFSEPPQPVDLRNDASSTPKSLDASIWMLLVDATLRLAEPYPLRLHLGGGDQNGCFFDIIASGQVLFDGDFLESLNIAWEISERRLADRSSKMDQPSKMHQPQVVRIVIPQSHEEAENDGFPHPFGILREIEGNSAGGLAGCAMLTLADGKVADGSITGSFTIKRKCIGRATAPEYIELAGVKSESLPWKVKAAAKASKFRGFLIFDSNDQRNPPRRSDKSVEDEAGGKLSLIWLKPGQISLALGQMQRNARHEQLLESLLLKVSDVWHRIEAAGSNPKSSELDKHVNQDHRFDCYVSPDYRIENPEAKVRPLKDAGQEVAAEASQSNPEDDDREVHIPGDPKQDEPLRKLLRLLIRPELNATLRHWPDMPAWLQKQKQKRSRWRNIVYDNAGSGKTVFTHRLMHVAAQPDTWRELFDGHPPVIVRWEGSWPTDSASPARYLSIREFLLQEMRKLHSEDHTGRPGSDAELQDAVDAAIRKKAVLIILDGFDQFPVPDQEHVAKLLNQDSSGNRPYELGIAQDHCHWVITGRVHAIVNGVYNKGLFDSDTCFRVRIDPFDEPQQDEYFEKTIASGIRISHRWKALIGITAKTSDKNAVRIRTRMNHLLQIPMNLVQLRRILENTEEGTPLPIFRTLSELSLVVGRLALFRNLTDKQKKEEIDQILGAQRDDFPREVEQQLETLERTLGVVAFQMMLEQNYDAQVKQSEYAAFQERCEARFCNNSNRAMIDAQDQRNPIREMQARRRLESDSKRFHANWKVLLTCDLELRSITEVFHSGGGIAFRSRKVMEAWAARYLTRYATDHDVWGQGQNQRECTKNDPEHRCAFDFSNDADWSECWRLATEMPRHKDWHRIPASSSYGTAFEKTQLDPVVTCRSLSVLFERPKNEIRPTELMYCAWPFFEYDDRLICEQLFLVPERSELVFGADLSPEERKDRGNDLVLPGAAKVIEERFRASNRTLMAELRENTAKYDCVPPRDSSDHAAWLRAWESSSSEEKSKTFLQCPPESWLRTAAKPGQPDPLITVIGDDESPCDDAKPRNTVRLAGSFWSLATPVTRGVYRKFDPAFETSGVKASWGGVIRKMIKENSDPSLESGAVEQNPDEYPIVMTSWWDSYMFCKWLGREYGLPSECQHEFLIRGGSAEKYCFGSDERLLDAYAWCSENSGGHAHAVGLKRSNAYGQFDVHGQVWEWSHDSYDKLWYQHRRDKAVAAGVSVIDADRGPSSGGWRSVRGSSFDYDRKYAESSFRDYGGTLGSRGRLIGFRVVRDCLSLESS